MLWAGAGLASQKGAVAAIIHSLMSVAYAYRIKSEESMLQTGFGDEVPVHVLNLPGVEIPPVQAEVTWRTVAKPAWKAGPLRLCCRRRVPTLKWPDGRAAPPKCD